MTAAYMVSLAHVSSYHVNLYHTVENASQNFLVNVIYCCMPRFTHRNAHMKT